MMPKWQIPADLEQLLNADDGGMWEDNSWAPIVLTVMKDITLEGRAIPMAWQIEFHQYEVQSESANQKIENLGIEPNSLGWEIFLTGVIEERHPDIVDELHFDSETDTCVVWVESEETCKRLIQVAWSLIHDS
jgi:hypothetical protein